MHEWEHFPGPRGPQGACTPRAQPGSCLPAATCLAQGRLSAPSLPDGLSHPPCGDKTGQKCEDLGEAQRLLWPGPAASSEVKAESSQESGLARRVGQRSGPHVPAAACAQADPASVGSKPGKVPFVTQAVAECEGCSPGASRRRSPPEPAALWFYRTERAEAVWARSPHGGPAARVTPRRRRTGDSLRPLSAVARGLPGAPAGRPPAPPLGCQHRQGRAPGPKGDALGLQQT